MVELLGQGSACRLDLCARHLEPAKKRREGTQPLRLAEEDGSHGILPAAHADHVLRCRGISSVMIQPINMKWDPHRLGTLWRGFRRRHGIGFLPPDRIAAQCAHTVVGPAISCSISDAEIDSAQTMQDLPLLLLAETFPPVGNSAPLESRARTSRRRSLSDKLVILEPPGQGTNYAAAVGGRQGWAPMDTLPRSLRRARDIHERVARSRRRVGGVEAPSHVLSLLARPFTFAQLEAGDQGLELLGLARHGLRRGR